MRKLGLIGGLGPGSTVHYYRELAKAHAGEMLIIHADMDRVLNEVQGGDRTRLAGYFAGLVQRLATGGADIAAISAITPHICIRELARISALPLVSMIDTTLAAIRARGYRRVALFGTRFVVQSKMFGMLEDIEVVVPDQVETIHNTYMQTVAGDPNGRAVLTRIATQLPVDAIVLAGTDLSLLFDETTPDSPLSIAPRLTSQGSCGNSNA